MTLVWRDDWPPCGRPQMCNTPGLGTAAVCPHCGRPAYAAGTHRTPVVVQMRPVNAAAVWAAVLGPLGFLLAPNPIWFGSVAALVVVPAIFAIGLGTRALRQISADPRQRGKTPAWIGIAFGGIAADLVTLQALATLLLRFNIGIAVTALILADA